MERKTFKAVYDEDLKPFLTNLGLWNTLQKRQLKCCFCNELITVENFGGVTKQNGHLLVFCNKTTCYFETLKNKKCPDG